MLYTLITYTSEDTEVTIPEKEDEKITDGPTDTNDPFSHEEIEWLLLELGQNLGLDLWLAKNDRNRLFKGHRLGEFKKIKEQLPVQFSPAVNRTIELIDVLWLDGDGIVAAFEVEHTTSIYSGLLRMSDLLVMQPNLSINLYIVAPDSRRGKVIEEINRPTFSKQKTPLNEHCQFIPYSPLKKKLEGVSLAGVIKHLKPGFIDDIAESCTT